MTRRRLALMALAVPAAAQTRAEENYQLDRFNEFAQAYNTAMVEIQAGKWPLRELKAVQRRWKQLQELPGWPKS